MPIVSALLKWYPHLQALSAVLADLGRHGHRLRQQPGDDVPAAADRRAAVPVRGLGGLRGTTPQDLLTTGVIEEINEIRWDVRPAPHLGTVEVRICDGVSTLTEMRALVALTHCLVVDLSDRLDRRREAADDAAVARAGEQVAGRPLRAGRLDHPRRALQRAPDAGRPPRSARAPAPVAERLGCVDDLALSRRSRGAARRTSASARSPTHRRRPGRGGGLRRARSSRSLDALAAGLRPGAGSGRSRRAVHARTASRSAISERSCARTTSAESSLERST